MNQLFNIDSPFLRFMSKLFDAVMLSLVFTLVCLPIVTIGPAITALYYSTVKSLRRNRSYPIKEFFHCFKRDFKQSFVFGLIIALVTFILYVDIRFMVDHVKNFATNFRVVYVIIGIFGLFLSIYAFPLISRFGLKMKELFKLSFYLSLRHLLTTIVSAILLFGAFAAVYVTVGFALFIVPVLCTYLISIMMERVLKSCMKLIGGDQANTNADQWYME